MPNAAGQVLLDSMGRRLLNVDGKLSCRCCSEGSCVCPEDVASTYTITFRWQVRDEANDCSAYLIDCTKTLTLTRESGDPLPCSWKILGTDWPAGCDYWVPGTGGTTGGNPPSGGLLAFDITLGLEYDEVNGCRWTLAGASIGVGAGLDGYAYKALADGPTGTWDDITGSAIIGSPPVCSPWDYAMTDIVIS